MPVTRLQGAFLPDPLTEDHTWEGTQTINLLVATTFRDSGGRALTMGKLLTVGEASDIGTLTIGTATFLFSGAAGFSGGYTLTLGTTASFTEAAGTGTITIAGLTHYFT